ncbi:MAG: Ser-Thr-rich GPI-anchored membrane family protein, partial [Limisphaerales bacterium]
VQGGQMGEFSFGYPDVGEIPYPPILGQGVTYPGVQPYEVIAPWMASAGISYPVNEALPIWLTWSPVGFSGWYHLQIAADSNFQTPVLDIPYQTDAFYVWNGAAPGTTYYWRVCTSNNGGTGDWSVGSFQTLAPFLSVTMPNGGEALRRGLPYFVRWSDDLAENVSLDLYKGGAFVRNIVASTPSTGAYKWSIPASLTPGSDYSVRITSTTNNTMVADSASTFSVVDPPVLSTVTQLGDGRLQFAITAPGAATARVLVSTNLTTWQVLQRVSLVNGSGVFTDNAPANLGKNFYRVALP